MTHVTDNVYSFTNYCVERYVPILVERIPYRGIYSRLLEDFIATGRPVRDIRMDKVFDDAVFDNIAEDSNEIIFISDFTPRNPTQISILFNFIVNQPKRVSVVLLVDGDIGNQALINRFVVWQPPYDGDKS